MTDSAKKTKSDLFNKTGEYLKNKRLESELSLREIADKVGCKAQFICNIERGKAFPPPEVMRGMISTYKIDQKELMNLLMQLQEKYYRSLYFSKSKRR